MTVSGKSGLPFAVADYREIDQKSRLARPLFRHDVTVLHPVTWFRSVCLQMKNAVQEGSEALHVLNHCLCLNNAERLEVDPIRAFCMTILRSQQIHQKNFLLYIVMKDIKVSCRIKSVLSHLLKCERRTPSVCIF